MENRVLRRWPAMIWDAIPCHGWRTDVESGAQVKELYCGE